LEDSQWLWISMANMYENSWGNCVGGVELTFVCHLISVHLIFLYTIAHWFDNFQNCATMNCQRNDNSIPPPQLPHTSSNTVATLTHNHFESLNTTLWHCTLTISLLNSSHSFVRLWLFSDIPPRSGAVAIRGTKPLPRQIYRKIC
jgi:hypothetical protein